MAIRHLEAGGTLLIFPSGCLEPDPAILPGAKESIGCWSRSAGLFLRAVPEAQLVIGIVSDILKPRFLNHPLAWIRKTPQDRQRVAEFVQTMYQLLYPGRYTVSPSVTFSSPVLFDQLLNERSRCLMQGILALTQQTLETHLGAHRSASN